jgi:hypothetical protein
MQVYAWQEYIPKKYVLVLVMELANRSLQKEIEVRKQAGRAFTEDELLSMSFFSFSGERSVTNLDYLPMLLHIQRLALLTPDLSSVHVTSKSLAISNRRISCFRNRIPIEDPC